MLAKMISPGMTAFGPLPLGACGDGDTPQPGGGCFSTGWMPILPYPCRRGALRADT